MFQLIPSDRAGFSKARISDDNLCIDFPVGTEPDWDQLSMSEYASEFEAARRDWEARSNFTTEK